MSVTGACAPLVEVEGAVVRTTGVAAATAEMGAQAVTTDLLHRHTAIVAGTAGIVTAQGISTRHTTAAEVELTTREGVGCHRPGAAVTVGLVEGSRTSRDHHRGHLTRVLPHHHSPVPDQDRSP